MANYLGRTGKHTGVEDSRPRHAERKRCSDPREKGCRGFARRNSDFCTNCGGGTRAAVKHNADGTKKQRGLVNIPPRIAALIDGSLDVSELDEEELARGYPRASDGSFRAPPVVIPKVLHDRMVRELFSRSDVLLRQNLVKATETMVEIAGNPEMDPKIRLQASQWIYERLRGKVPDVVVTGDVKKWEEVLEGVYRGPDTGATVVDAEVVQDDGRTP